MLDLEVGGLPFRGLGIGELGVPQGGFRGL